MYEIVIAFSSSDLKQKVNSLMKKGWLPVGGIAFDSSNVNKVYYQAMIKK